MDYENGQDYHSGTTSQAINLVKSWMNEIQFEDDFDLCLYMQYAGRLAALGDNSGIDSLSSIFHYPQYQGRIDEIVENRVKEGHLDLDEQICAHFYVIEALDFQSLAQHCGDILSDQSKKLIEKWAEHALSTPLDNDAVEYLRNHTVTFPSENYRTPSVSANNLKQLKDECNG